MSINLDEDIKELLIGGKHYLQANDLEGFYDDYLAQQTEYEDLPVDFIGEITDYLRSKGIYFEDYVNFVPKYACAAGGVPKQWLQGDTLIIPSKIQYLHKGAFAEDDSLIKVDLSNIHKVGPYAFAYCIKLEELTVGASTQLLEDCLYGVSSLETIYVPNESVGKRILKDLPNADNHPDRKHYVYPDVVDETTGEVYN